VSIDSGQPLEVVVDEVANIVPHAPPSDH